MIDARPPRFFSMSYGVDVESGDPWAGVIQSSTAADNVCRLCGNTRCTPVGRAIADHLSGREWADVIGAGGGDTRCIVSERVATDLCRSRLAGFDTYPVLFGSNISNNLARNVAPEYRYLSTSGGLDIDLAASGLSVNRCSGCSTTSDLREPMQLVPIEATWTGAAIFNLRNYPIATLFCTFDVLELARKKRWKNFKFQPIDVLRRYQSGWDGIDYLDGNWPPKVWYPHPPGYGKKLSELLSDLQGDDGSKVYEARLALLEIGDSAVPQLSRLLSGELDSRTHEVAIMLYGINQKSPLSEDLKRRLRSYLDKNLNAAMK